MELVQVDVQAAIESEGSSDTGHDLSDDPIEIGEAWRLNVEVLLADVVYRLIIDLTRIFTQVNSTTVKLAYHEGAVNMFKGSVSREDAVVRLYNGVGHLRSGIHCELEFGLFAIIARKPLKQESAL